MRPIILASILLGLVAAPVHSQVLPSAKREKRVTVFGAELCPKSADPENEVIICTRENPNNQFRIPEGVRNETKIARRDNVGAERTALADHSMAPTSCTAAGFQGQFGCSQGINILGAARAAKAVVTGDTPVPDPQP